MKKLFLLISLLSLQNTLCMDENDARTHISRQARDLHLFLTAHLDNTQQHPSNVMVSALVQEINYRDANPGILTCLRDARPELDHTVGFEEYLQANPDEYLEATLEGENSDSAVPHARRITIDTMSPRVTAGRGCAITGIDVRRNFSAAKPLKRFVLTKTAASGEKRYSLIKLLAECDRLPLIQELISKSDYNPIFQNVDDLQALCMEGIQRERAAGNREKVSEWEGIQQRLANSATLSERIETAKRVKNGALHYGPPVAIAAWALYDIEKYGGQLGRNKYLNVLNRIFTFQWKDTSFSGIHKYKNDPSYFIIDFSSSNGSDGLEFTVRSVMTLAALTSSRIRNAWHNAVDTVDKKCALDPKLTRLLARKNWVPKAITHAIEAVQRDSYEDEDDMEARRYCS